eukprot:1932219-Rhodomonas_salina.1
MTMTSSSSLMIMGALRASSICRSSALDGSMRTARPHERAKRHLSGRCSMIGSWVGTNSIGVAKTRAMSIVSVPSFCGTARRRHEEAFSQSEVAAQGNETCCQKCGRIVSRARGCCSART